MNRAEWILLIPSVLICGWLVAEMLPFVVEIFEILGVFHG